VFVRIRWTASRPSDRGGDPDSMIGGAVLPHAGDRERHDDGPRREAPDPHRGCFASMSFQQAHQYFSAVWADGFPRSRHHAVSDVR